MKYKFDTNLTVQIPEPLDISDIDDDLAAIAVIYGTAGSYVKEFIECIKQIGQK